jgi:hypothetical protein
VSGGRLRLIDVQADDPGFAPAPRGAGFGETMGQRELWMDMCDGPGANDR